MVIHIEEANVKTSIKRCPRDIFMPLRNKIGMITRRASETVSAVEFYRYRFRIGNDGRTCQLRNRNTMRHNARMGTTDVYFQCEHDDPHHTKRNCDYVRHAPDVLTRVCDQDYGGYHAQACFPMVD